MKFNDIHITAISQEVSQPSITKIRLTITFLKFHFNFPGANELIITMSQPGKHVSISVDQQNRSGVHFPWFGLTIQIQWDSTAYQIATNICSCYDSTAVMCKFFSNPFVESGWKQNKSFIEFELRWKNFIDIGPCKTCHDWLIIYICCNRFCKGHKKDKETMLLVCWTNNRHPISQSPIWLAGMSFAEHSLHYSELDQAYFR